MQNSYVCFFAQIVYAIWQVEKAPDTGRLHCQAYCRYTAQVAFSRVVALFSAGGHVTLANGDEQSNIDYCSKEDTHVLGPWEFGKRAKQGKRNDIVVVRDLVKSGKGMRTICETATSYQSMRAGELMLKYLEPARDSSVAPDVRWYYGSTGSGKTREALAEFPGAWVSQKDGQWFEGYDAHETCIFDDFRKDFCQFHVLLRLLDRHQYRIMCKGGSRQLLATVIIITCPWHPEVLFENRSGEDLAQLMRRITTLRQFGDIVPPPVAPLVIVGNSVSVGTFRARK